MLKFSKNYIVFMVLAMFCGPLVAKECTDSKGATTPSKRFKVKNNTVYDSKTKLTWSRCPLGMTLKNNACVGVPDRMTWSDAKFEMFDLNQQGGMAGHKDWRLPTLKELRTLVEKKCYEPSINRKVFPNTPSIGFWTSVLEPHYEYGAWMVYFLGGSSFMGNKQQDWAVRPVRK